MYVREKKSKLTKKTAIQLVKAVREGDKVRQVIIRHFGAAEDAKDILALKSLAQKYKLELESKSEPTLFDSDASVEGAYSDHEAQDDRQVLDVDLGDIQEEKRVKVGIHQVYGNIFKKIGFHHTIDKYYRRKASVRLMRDVVMTRIEHPESKLSSSKTLKEKYGIRTNVNSIYRMMDLIDDKAIDRLQKSCFENTFGLLGEKIDVIFYDCTTLYFESFIEDELKRNGYSKDGKFNQAQVILALMVSHEGLPVGYELFHGATFEGHTLEHALERLHNKYNIDKLVFVADSAMISKQNMEMLEQYNQPYIVAARLKNQPKSIVNTILDRSQYQMLENANEDPGESLSYREIALNDGQKLVVTHSPKRAAKDEHDRHKAIEQLKKRLSRSKNPSNLINNYGYKRFLKLTGDAKISINEEKIKLAERWDGLHGVITNCTHMPVQEILSHYKGLWQIEETFRISKSNLRMRPIFHWTPPRIKAHIAICYMALACVRTLEHMVRLQYKKLSPEVIRKDLSSLELSLLVDVSTGRHYALPSKATNNAKKIYKILGMRWRETVYPIK